MQKVLDTLSALGRALIHTGITVGRLRVGRSTVEVVVKVRTPSADER